MSPREIPGPMNGEIMDMGTTDSALFGIVGAGGFGREVMPVALEMLEMVYMPSDFEMVFVDDHDAAEPVNGHRVMTTHEFTEYPREKYFNVAIADHNTRERIANELIASNGIPFQIKALNSVCLDHSEIGEGAILCPFTTITSNSRIGKFFHANIYSYVAHDCTIGDFVTFAPGVHCNGKITIEDHAYIGAGAMIKQGTQTHPMVIGRGAVVGMGAVVTKSVDPFTTVVGNPAAPLHKKEYSFAQA